MIIEKAIIIIENHQRWRRGDETITMCEPVILTRAIDVLIKHVKEQKRKK